MECVVRAPGQEFLPDSYDGVLQGLGLGRIRTSGFVELAGHAYYFKINSYPTPVRRITRFFQNTGPWVTPPHLAEYRNLCWLRAHGLPAPRPAAAGYERRWGLIVSHFLLTERIDGARDLFGLLREDALDAELLVPLCSKLGGVIGSMHEQGFVHRDLFLRNILLDTENPEALQVWLIDCRKGSHGWLKWRGPTYDLGCFEKWAATLLPAEARLAFFRAYFGARPGCKPRAMLRGCESWRRKLVRFFHRKKRYRLDFKPVMDAEPLGVS